MHYLHNDVVILNRRVDVMRYRNSGAIVLAVCIIIASPVSMPGKTEVSKTRAQFWARTAFLINSSENRRVFFAMVSSRYNYYTDGLKKSEKGALRFDNTDGFWQNRLWAGPVFQIKLLPALKNMTHLLYEGTVLYADEKAVNLKGDTFKRYIRHGAEVRNSFVFHGNGFNVCYRTMFTNRFGADTGNGECLDNEIINRHGVSLRIPLISSFSIFFMEEVYLKLTADDTDLDGTETFHKNALWAGVGYRPLNDFHISMRYCYMYTNCMDLDAKSIQVYDHFICFHIQKSFQINMHKKKKAI